MSGGFAGMSATCACGSQIHGIPALTVTTWARRMRRSEVESTHRTPDVDRFEVDVVMTSMFMQVNLKCAHRARPPPADYLANWSFAGARNRLRSGAVFSF